MTNQLIIGLGCNGSNVLCELKKRIYEEFRSNTFDHVILQECAPDDFMQSLYEVTQNLHDDEEVTFHICTSLLEGTGCIIDAITQIRKLFPLQLQMGIYRRIYLYLHLSGQMPGDTGTIAQARSYAALLELNALLIGLYLPKEADEAFDPSLIYTYIYTDVNEQGIVLDETYELPAAVAEFIFQVAIGNREIWCRLDRMIEICWPGIPEKQDGIIVHSRNFGSFGIAKATFPEMEIREFITYKYALQAVHQFLYNKWQEGIGYIIWPLEKADVSFVDEILDKKNQERLMLSNRYLTLERPIIDSPATQIWQLFEETWETHTQAEADDVIATVDKKQWLTNLSARCEEFFNHQFRQCGVTEFYKSQQLEREIYAHTVRRHIEKRLFDKWLYGTGNSQSILEIASYTRLLIENCNSRIAVFDTLKAQQEEEQANLSRKIGELTYNWSKMTLLNIVMHKPQKIFQLFRSMKSEYYTAATYIAAYGYAKELLQDIVKELEHMLGSITTFEVMFRRIDNELQQQITNRWPTDEVLPKWHIKIYNPEAVRSICQQWVSNKNEMDMNAVIIRTRMVNNLGEDGEHTFANLCDKNNDELLLHTLLDVCQNHSSHNIWEMAKNDSSNKMVKVNILEKLESELDTKEKMEQFVKSMVQASRTYARFDPIECAKVIPGNVETMTSLVQLVLPEADEQTNDFRLKLIDAFRKEVPRFDPKQDVTVNYKNDQIMVISANYGFPLRFLIDVKFAKEKYEALVSDEIKSIVNEQHHDGALIYTSDKQITI